MDRLKNGQTRPEQGSLRLSLYMKWLSNQSQTARDLDPVFSLFYHTNYKLVLNCFKFWRHHPFRSKNTVCHQKIKLIYVFSVKKEKGKKRFCTKYKGLIKTTQSQPLHHYGWGKLTASSTISHLILWNNSLKNHWWIKITRHGCLFWLINQGKSSYWFQKSHKNPILQ